MTAMLWEGPISGILERLQRLESRLEHLENLGSAISDRLAGIPPNPTQLEFDFSSESAENDLR